MMKTLSKRFYSFNANNILENLFAEPFQVNTTPSLGEKRNEVLWNLLLTRPDLQESDNLENVAYYLLKDKEKEELFFLAKEAQDAFLLNLKKSYLNIAKLKNIDGSIAFAYAKMQRRTYIGGLNSDLLLYKLIDNQVQYADIDKPLLQEYLNDLELYPAIRLYGDIKELDQKRKTILKSKDAEKLHDVFSAAICLVAPAHCGIRCRPLGKAVPLFNTSFYWHSLKEDWKKYLKREAEKEMPVSMRSYYDPHQNVINVLAELFQVSEKRISECTKIMAESNLINKSS